MTWLLVSTRPRVRVDHHAGARGPLAAVLQRGVDDDDALPGLGQAAAGRPVPPLPGMGTAVLGSGTGALGRADGAAVESDAGW